MVLFRPLLFSPDARKYRSRSGIREYLQAKGIFGVLMKRILLAVLLIVGFATTLHAEPDRGLCAYIRGDYDAAFNVWQPAATEGDSVAQYRLGLLYFDGKGVAQSSDVAVVWLRKSAEQGHVIAQYRLGLIYYVGQGLPVDYFEAAKWFRLAAEQGHAKAQYQLGLMHTLGRGVPLDRVEASGWYRRSADQDVTSAQLALARMLEDGEGETRNDARALYWYRRAAERGNSTAARKSDEISARMNGERRPRPSSK